MKLKLKHHFDAAHRLEFHQGKCKNLHGHRWDVIIEIDIDNCEEDMIMDFGLVKEIIDSFDHKTILKDCELNKNLIKVLKEEELNVLLLDYSPTAENLAEYIGETIKNYVVENTLLVEFSIKVELFESPNASITYETRKIS